MAYDEKTAERVRALLSKRRDVAERKMMGGLAFMASGAMCCSVSGKGGLLVRVRAEEYGQMLREPHVAQADMRGRVMTGFVRVAAEGYRTDAALKKWVERGVDAAAARPKKPPHQTKRGAAAKGGRRASGRRLTRDD
jgi:TfoX/Sxy family transcriptional regulator of competence genes